MQKTYDDFGQKAIKPLLRRIGLDEKETEIYLSLLSLKAARASDVAKQARQSRSHAYLILRSLEEKGLVSEVEQGGILLFIAEPPERLISFLKDKEEECRELQSLVEGALPVLSVLTKSYEGSPRVTVLKGLDGMKQVYRDILTQEFMGIYNSQTALDVFGKNIVTMLFGKTARLRGRDLVVNNDAAQSYLKDIPSNGEYTVRLLPKDVTFDTDTMIYGDTVALLSFDDERTVIRIENRKIASAFRAWFEMMWKISKATS